MRLSDYMHPDLVFANLRAGSSRDLLDLLAGKVCESYPNLEKTTCLDSLLQREREFSTGLECGIAVPHATVPGVEKTVCVVCTLASPVEIETTDGIPVRIVFMLLSPPNAIANHVRILARIARLCSLEDFPARIRAAEDSESLFQVITEEDQRHV